MTHEVPSDEEAAELSRWWCKAFAELALIRPTTGGTAFPTATGVPTQ